MTQDIRDKAFITHDDVVGLNFIKTDGPYVFRRHFRQGLRSHILEVLKRQDMARESTGIIVDGLRWFPKAKPACIFRIFRTRLKTVDNALKEIGRVKIVEKFLAPDFIARSSEFLVDYHGPQGPDLMLCGFQRYVEGEIIDPWTLLQPRAYLSTLYDSLKEHLHPQEVSKAQWIQSAQQNAARLVNRIKKMVWQTGYLPDLAGIGNLVISQTGEIKLVDINNISHVVFDDRIRIDDRGYPVCDKSIEALALLEEKVIGRTPNSSEILYQTFLNPQRQSAVKKSEAQFSQMNKHLSGYPALNR
jgi:hypothetical protein